MGAVERKIVDGRKVKAGDRLLVAQRLHQWLLLVRKVVADLGLITGAGALANDLPLAQVLEPTPSCGSLSRCSACRWRSRYGAYHRRRPRLRTCRGVAGERQSILAWPQPPVHPLQRQAKSEAATAPSTPARYGAGGRSRRRGRLDRPPSGQRRKGLCDWRGRGFFQPRRTA